MEGAEEVAVTVVPDVLSLTAPADGDRFFEVDNLYVRLRPRLEPLVFGSCAELDSAGPPNGWDRACQG